MKQELNDILINDDDLQKQNRTKKLMMMVAMALIFLCVLIAVIFVLTSSDEESTEQKIAQENGLVAAPNGTSGFEPVELGNNQDSQDQFQAILDNIRKQQGLDNDSQESNQPKPTQPSLPTSTQTSKPESIKPEPVKPAPVLPSKPTENPKKPEPTKPAVKEPTNQQEVAKNPLKPAQPTPSTQTPKTPSPAPGANQTQTPGSNNSVVNAFNEVSTPRMDTSKNGQIAEKGFYIQIGSFTNKPNAEFLKKISNYSYRVYDGASSNGTQTTRYLIGPYSSRTEASRDLPNFKSLVANPIHFEVK